MRVNPLSKSDTHDVGKVILSKTFAKMKLMEFDKEYVHGLPDAIIETTPLVDLPVGYEGYLMVANYETKGLKEYDEQRDKDSRLLRNKFSPPKTLEDIAYVYAVTTTLCNYLSEYSFNYKNKLRVFIPALVQVEGMGSIGIKSADVDKYLMQIFVLVADLADESVMYDEDKPKDWKKNPQSTFLEGVIKGRYQTLAGQVAYNKILLKVRENRAENSILKRFYEEYVLSRDKSGVSLENPGDQDLPLAESTRGVINGFNFRLGNYGVTNNKPFYLIGVKKSNSTTLDSLRIPKWFLQDKSIKKFLLDIDKEYAIILEDIMGAGFTDDLNLKPTKGSPRRGNLHSPQD
jgi:hypothetical protein